MTTKKPFHEYILAQLRELELTSSMLAQIREKYRAAARRRDAARGWYSRHMLDPDRRRAMAEYIALNRADARAHALSCAVDILERRKAVLSDEITRAVVVNALRGIFRAVLRCEISGAEIARRYRDLSEAVTLTRWLRNVDLAREVKLWEARKDFSEPPKLSEDYVERFILTTLFGYSTSQRNKNPWR